MLDHTVKTENTEIFVNEHFKQEIIDFEEVNIKEEATENQYQETEIEQNSIEIKIEPEKSSIETENLIENNSTNDQKCKCHVCGKFYCSTYVLEKHKCGFKCDFCNEIFKKKSDLTVHKICFHEEIKKNHKCNICNETFISLQNLKGHIKNVHEEIKKYKCECCGNEYSQLYDLMIHKKSVHDVRTLKNPKEQNNFRCDICSKCFDESTDIIQHVKTVHKDMENYKCKKIWF